MNARILRFAILYLLYQLLTIVSAPGADPLHVRYTYEDPFGNPVKIKEILIEPLFNYALNSNSVVSLDAKRFQTDANGTKVVSNILSGYSYRVTLTGSWGKTVFTNHFPTNATGLVYAKDFIEVSTNLAGGNVAYSMAAANARFIVNPESKTNGQYLKYDGTNWVAAEVEGGGALGPNLEAWAEENPTTFNAPSATSAGTADNAHQLNNKAEEDLSVAHAQTAGTADTATNALDAEKLNGLDSSAYVTNGGVANVTSTNATHLDGVPASGYLTRTNPPPVQGSLVINSPSTIYGGDGKRIGINTNSGPAFDDYLGIFRFLADTSGFRFMDQTSTKTWADFDTNGFTLYPAAVGGLVGQGDSRYGDVGAQRTADFGFVGGSGSSLSDLPLRGPEIWQYQPKPVLLMLVRAQATIEQLTNETTFVTATNMMHAIRTNGIDSVTNRGVRVGLWFDVGWQNSSRVNGRLMWNTNNFPLGIPHLARLLHTNGFELHLANYYSPLIPRSPNTQVLVTMDGNNEYLYPSQTPSGWVHPTTTPDTVRIDIASFYDWEIDGLHYQNTISGTGHAAYGHQQSRQIANACIYPGVVGSEGQSKLWRSLYTNRFGDRAMNLVLYLGSKSAQTMFINSANGINIDQFDPDVERTSSGATFGLAYGRTYHRRFVHLPDSSIHPAFVLNSGNVATWGTNDYKGFFAAAAMWNATIGMSYQEITNEAPWVKNKGFLDVWQDDGQHWLTLGNDNVTNSVWIKRLVPSSRRAVLFVNEGNNTANLSASWLQLGFPTNTIAHVSEVWSGTAVGWATNTITASVPASNHVWYIVETVPEFARALVPGSMVTNLNVGTANNAFPGLTVKNALGQNAAHLGGYPGFNTYFSLHLGPSDATTSNYRMLSDGTMTRFGTLSYFDWYLNNATKLAVLTSGGVEFTGGTITNGATVWLSTNATPNTPLPDGSIATVTDGRLFVRTNSTWKRVLTE
jgi:hypothetical protein